MALRKPSDLFNKKETSGVFESPEVSSHITESYDKFRDNFDKVNELSEKVEVLSKELSEKLTKSDLENAMLSQLMVLDENFKSLQNQVKGLNKQDLKEFKETVSNLSEIVDNLVETELPKYKKQITKSELYVGEQVNQLQEVVETNVSGIRKEIDEKFDNIADVVDNNINYFNQKLEETSSQVKKTTETYTNISKILENKVSKENEKFEEYSELIENLSQAFEQLALVLKEELSSSSQFIEEKFEYYKKEFESISSNLEASFDDISSNLEASVDVRLEDYHKEILDIKADVVIFEKHNKDTERTIQEFSEELSKISKIDDSIHSLEENVELLQSQYEIVSNTTTETKKDLELIEQYIQSRRQDIVQLKEEVFTEIEKLPVGNLQENIERLEKKIDYIKETYSKIEPEVVVKEVIKEGLLNEPPETNNSDPLTPLNQNFVTLDQLQEHYRLFINRIQQQLSTIGGGGETRLKYLDDIVGIATNPSAYNNKFLKYNHSIGKFEFATAGGGAGSQTLDDTLQLGNTSSLGMSVGQVTSTLFIGDLSGNATSASSALYANNSGQATTAQGLTGTPNLNVGFTTITGVGNTALTVNGDARITGILTIGTGSITLNGNNDSIRIGTGLTITSTGNASYSGILTASSFSGSGANLTNLNATNLTSGIIPATRITDTSSLSVAGDLYVTGNISFGGTTTQLNTQQLEIVDADIVLGIGTTFNSTDNTANHGGIAIASTEGYPLVNINIHPAETNPPTYKKFMWFKNNTAGLGTDAWLSNYAVGIGSTQFPIGTRLATGSVQFTENDLAVVRSINASGIVTASSFSGPLTGNVTGSVNSSGIVTASSFSGSGASLTGIITSLVAGTNVTIVQSAGIATISATGGGGGGVTSIIAGSGISVDQSTGDVTVSATGGGGAGTNLGIVLASTYNMLMP